jgi:hypothetical protein
MEAFSPRELLYHSICRLGLILSVGILLAACAGFPIPGNGDSYKTKGETVGVTLNLVDPPKPNTVHVSVAPLAVAAIGVGVDLATQFVKTHLDQEALKYTATYTGADPNTQTKTLSALSGELGTGLSNISVIRYARYGGGDGQECFKASISIHPLDPNSTSGPYYFSINSISDSHPKTKVPLFESRVDLTLTVTLNLQYYTNNKTFKSDTTTSTASLTLLRLPIGPDFSQSGWYSLTDDSYSTDTAPTSQKPGAPNVLIQNIKSAPFALPDASAMDPDKPIYVTATVSAVESDDFGQKISALSTNYSSEESKIEAALDQYLSGSSSSSNSSPAR